MSSVENMQLSVEKLKLSAHLFLTHDAAVVLPTRWAKK